MNVLAAPSLATDSPPERKYVSDAHREALELLDGEADPVVAEWAEAKLAARTHEWVYDPEVEGVIGLAKLDHNDQPTSSSSLTVYIEDRDFEMDESDDDLVAMRSRE